MRWRWWKKKIQVSDEEKVLKLCEMIREHTGAEAVILGIFGRDAPNSIAINCRKSRRALLTRELQETVTKLTEEETKDPAPEGW